MTEPDVSRLVRSWRRELVAATEELDRVATVLEERAQAMWDAMVGHPPGRGFDGDGRGGGVSFCEAHGRERCACGAGVSFVARSDRTGEAALQPDPAAADRRRVEHLLGSLRRQAFELGGIVGRYGPRSASARERSETLRANERDVSCWSCARVADSRGVAAWSPAARSAEVGGERRDLCWWCFDWLRKGDGSLPSRVQVGEYLRTGRVRRR